MVARQIFPISALIVIVLVGCTAVLDPTPTPENVAGEVATVMVTRPLATTTPIPPIPTPRAIQATETAVLISTDLSSPTDAPKPTPTHTPYPTATPLTLPDLTWANSLDELTTVDGSSLAWSPVRNQYVFAQVLCDGVIEETRVRIFIADSPTFEPTEITPVQLVCNGLWDDSDFLWHPDGEFFLLSALPNKDDYVDNSTWKISQDGQSWQELPLVGKWLDFSGWLNDTQLVHSQYMAGVSWEIGITDIETGETTTSTYVHAGGVEALTMNFVIASDGDGLDIYSVVALSTEIINPEDTYNPYEKSLSFSNYQFQYVSMFDDVLPGTNQILVTTYDLETLPGEASEEIIRPEEGLHLWNPETDELTLLIPDSTYGRFSPDSHYLAYLTVDSNSHYLHLLDRNSGQIIFSQPATSPGMEDKSRFDFNSSPYISFSPDGRTLTFYSPTPELMLYDLETGEFLPPLTAVPFTPLWSPDSNRFVYQHPTDGLSIFDRRTNTTYPLATTGGKRLSNPQWSYDGTYLSVTVQQEDGSRDTAVLQIP
jgi:WD40 repeat protein